MRYRRTFTTPELMDIWKEFEAKEHIGPGYHLCAEDVHKFLAFLDEKEIIRDCSNCKYLPEWLPLEGDIVCPYYRDGSCTNGSRWRLKIG